MEVIVRPDREQAVSLVAEIILDRLRAKPEIVLGLATGRTMTRVYDLLAQSAVSFACVTTFNLDEYVGLSAEHPGSFARYMRDHLFEKVDIDPARAHLPDGAAADLRKAAHDFEELIKKAGGIDLQLLGIGENGHIGFNEPASALMSRTRDKTLTPTTRAQNAAFFCGDPNMVPPRALTMGIGTILDAKELILLATGEGKAGIVARAVEGPITASVSASALQLHPNCKVVLDEDAAGSLKFRDYYDFVFENEPEWAKYRR
ncbi:MAG: glucosamine-6-phosphate deaminase [Hyphomicrobiaceae bacterium]|nr:glucosamine-6-phosphate deaminase [Hyphomicrobiaceae bacterium]